MRLYPFIDAFVHRAYLAVVARTSSFDVLPLLPLVEEIDGGLSAIVAVWHSELNLLLLLIRRLKWTVHVLVSSHHGADKYASLAAQEGISVLRPKSADVFHEQFQLAKELLMQPGNLLLVFVDGPFGPNRVVKSGVSLLAMMSGAPIIPIHCEARRFWIGSTWDNRVYPRPKNHFRCRAGNLLRVRMTSKAALKKVTNALQSELDCLCGSTSYVSDPPRPASTITGCATQGAATTPNPRTPSTLEAARYDSRSRCGV